jgi:hypothetical protein
MTELSIAIAGVRTATVTRDPDLAGLVRDRYKGFLSSGPADWRLAVRAQPSGAPFADDVVVRRAGGRLRFSVQRQDFAGTIDVGERTADVALAGPDDVSIDSFVRILYSLALLDVQGLVLHASSLVKNGRAYLFCGPSGSGKTTITRLSPDATLLSDELSVARVAERKARCYGTPFWGELARAGEDQSAPLVGIYFLHHGSGHAVAAVRPRQALERLLPNVLFFAREPALTARVLSIAADLVETVPCFDLTFRLDPGFWEVVDRA